MLKGTGSEACIASPLTTFIHPFCKEPPWNESKVVATLFPAGGWVIRGINTAFIKKHKDIEVPPLLWPFRRGVSTVEGVFQLDDISILFLELPMVFHVILDQLSQRGKLLSPIEVIVVTCVLDLDVGDSSSSSKIWKRGQKNPSQVSWWTNHFYICLRWRNPYSQFQHKLLPLCFSFSAQQAGRTGKQFCAGGVPEGTVNPATSGVPPETPQSHSKSHTQAQGWRVRRVEHSGETQQSWFAPFSRIPSSSQGLSLRKHLPLPAATVSNIKEEQLPAGIPSCATRALISQVSKQHNSYHQSHFSLFLYLLPLAVFSPSLPCSVRG